MIDEAVDSVLAQTYSDFEIIIVNDGSTDLSTASVLKSYHRRCTRVIHTDNQGLASARNNGIREAAGTYILPLDADDKIAGSYLESAVAILDANPNVGIVYCQAEFFGEKSGIWELPDYSFPEILLGNVIFASGFFRRLDWERVDGYKPNMSGLEDYDFWLSLIELGRQVHRIPEPLPLPPAVAIDEQVDDTGTVDHPRYAALPQSRSPLQREHRCDRGAHVRFVRKSPRTAAAGSAILRTRCESSKTSPFRRRPAKAVHRCRCWSPRQESNLRPTA